MKGSRIVKQRDGSDCGAACLVSVAAHYGMQVQMQRVRALAGTDRQGTSLLGLMEAAEALRFSTKAMRSKTSVLPTLPLPAIFHLSRSHNSHHYVVAYKMTSSEIEFMDPSPGKMISSLRTEFEKSWTGIVMLLLPAQEFESFPVIQSPSDRLQNFVRPYRRILFKTFLAALLYTLFSLAIPLYVLRIFDHVLPLRDRSAMKALSFVMLTLLFFQMITGYIRSRLTFYIARRMDRELIAGYYQQLLQLPQHVFDGMRVRELVSRVNDAMRIRFFISETFLTGMLHAVTVLLCTIIMFFFNWKLAGIMLVSVPAYLIIYRISSRLNMNWQQKKVEASTALENQLMENIEGIATIRRFNATAHFKSKMDNHLKSFLHAVYAGGISSLNTATLSEWISGILKIIILWVGSSLIIDHRMSIGELFSFYMLTVFFVMPIQTLIGMNKHVQEASLSRDRFFELMDLERENIFEDKTRKPFPSGDLFFTHIKFGYRPGHPVFENLHFQIHRNEITGITGCSGCGKSTLLALIQRLYEPAAGFIRIGDTDIHNIPLSELRRNIAVVTQRTDLFSDTYATNITMGDHFDPIKMNEICNQLGLDSHIEMLPEKYQSEMPIQNLSVGEKQKIAIARALYRDPEILILDEFAALDFETEKKFLNLYGGFMERKKRLFWLREQIRHYHFATGS